MEAGLHSEQTVAQNPVTTDAAGGSKRLHFSLSYQPGLQRRHLWTCQLCTFELDKPGVPQRDFLRCLFRAKFPFHFSVLAGAIFSLVSFDFPPRSSHYLLRTQLQYLCSTGGEAAVACSRSRPPAPCCRSRTAAD